MALQTIQQRILDAVGDTIGGVISLSALMIKDWVNMGIRVIIGRIPTRKCEQLFSTAPSKFAPTTGLALETQKLISVLRDDDDNIPRMCDKVPYKKSSQLNDVNSLYAPSKVFPKFVLEPQTDSTIKIKVYPVSGSSIATANMVSFIEVDPAVLTVLAGFPDELEPYVDLYAVIQCKIRSMGYYKKIMADEINGISGTTVVSNTNFTNQTSVVINHGLGYFPLVDVLDTNGVEVGKVITHDVATKNFYTVTFLFLQSGTIITSVPTSSGGDLASFVAALPTWVAVTMGTMPTIPILEADASNVSALIGAIPTFDGTTTTTLADISTTRIVNTLNQAGDLIWKAPDGSTDNINPDVEFFLTENDSEMAREASVGANSQVGIAKGEIETEIAKLGNWDKEYNAKVRNFVAQVNAWLAEWKTYTDEDNLKLVAYKEEVTAVVQEYRADIENEAKRFGLAVEKARSYLQSAQIRLGILGNYSQTLASLPNEIVALQKRFDIGVDSYVRQG